MNRDRDLVTNAADPEQVERAERKEKDRKRRRRSLLRQQMSTPDGREFVWSELEAAGIFEDCTSAEAPVAFAFLGRRRQGLSLLMEVMADHGKEWLLMQGEAVAREEKERRENAAARTPRAARAD